MRKCWTTPGFPSSGKVIYPAKKIPLELLFNLFVRTGIKEKQDLKSWSDLNKNQHSIFGLLVFFIIHISDMVVNYSTGLQHQASSINMKNKKIQNYKLTPGPSLYKERGDVLTKYNHFLKVLLSTGKEGQG
jgi:hypothetical protein